MKYKIDNHIIEIERKEKFLKIYYYYNNNLFCTDFLYDILNKKYFAFAGYNSPLTKRQENKLNNIINNFLKVKG